MKKEPQDPFWFIRASMTLIFLTWLFLVWLAVNASGEDVCGPNGCRVGPALPSTQTAHPAVVRVCNETDKTYCYGSGTLIEEAGQSLILTCAHIFREGSSRIWVGFSTGQQVEAKLLKQDQLWDLAVLAIPKPDWSVPPRTIATDWPKKGEEVQSCGWGEDMIYHCNNGRIKGYFRLTETTKAQMLELTGNARDGDSGGPAFNSRGELVAVCWGTDGRTVSGTYCGRIRQFLRNLLGIQRPLVPVKPGPPVVVREPYDPDDYWPDLMPGLVDGIDSAGNPVGNPSSPPPAEPQPPVVVDPPVRPQVDPGLGNRLGKIEDALVGLAAVGAVESPSLMTLAAPALAALGWTGPPAIAAVMGLKVASALIRRRRRKKERAGDPAGEFPGSIPRDDTEAAQILQLSKREGRSPVLDALVGRIAFDELDKAIDSKPDGPQADWARGLKRTLQDRFNEMAPPALYAAAKKPL